MSTSVNNAISRLSLRTNFTWTFFGNIVYAGCQWGMLVALARLGTPEMVGKFALGFAVTAPVMMFASLRIREVEATDAKSEYSFSDYLGLRLITTILAFLVIVAIVAIADYEWETRLVILALGVAKSFESISDVLYGLLQKRERMDRIAKSLLIKGPLSLGLLSIVVYLTGSVFWGTVALASAWGLVLASYDVRNAAWILKLMPEPGGPSSAHNKHEATLHPRWEKRTLAKLAWLALPLGVVELLSSLNANIPRYFIEGYLGASLLGIFAALAYFDRAGDLVAHSLGRTVSPKLSQYYAEGDGIAFRRLLLKVIGVGVLLGVMGVLIALVAGDAIVAWFYGSEYVRHHVLIVLMLAAAMNYVAKFVSYALTAARRFRALMLLGIVVTIVLALSCGVFIPSEGLYGAAFALLVSRFVEISGAFAVAALVLLAFQRAKARGGGRASWEIHLNANRGICLHRCRQESPGEEFGSCSQSEGIQGGAG